MLIAPYSNLSPMMTACRHSFSVGARHRMYYLKIDNRQLNNSRIYKNRTDAKVK